MATLYHSAPVLLSAGSIVLPGNYGRIIRARGEAHPFWQREMELEAVRQAVYPTKPSRLAACFACTSVETLRFYVGAQMQKSASTLHPILYEVVKVEPDAPEHSADFNVVQPLPGRPEDMTGIAHLYWTAKLWVTVSDAPGVRCEEIVTTSPLRIVKRLPD